MEQLNIFSLLTDFTVGEEVFFVSLDNITKAVITAVGKYVEWTDKDGTECYCTTYAANQYLFRERKEANKKAINYKKQFKGSK